MLAQRLGLSVAALSLALCASCQAAPEEGEPPPPVKARAALVTKLGRRPVFLIGHGNDLPTEETSDKGEKSPANFNGERVYKQAGIYTLPVGLDIHYAILSGVQGQPWKGAPSWADIVPNGGFVTAFAKNANASSVLPMFTLSMTGANGEKNFEALRDPELVTRYWASVRLLFERLAELDQPALVHVEPSFWGFAQEASQNDDPATIPVALKSYVPECRELPADVGGMGRCIVRLGKKIAPKVAVGLHASDFGHRGRPDLVAKFLRQCGALEADFVVVETLNRDAGCLEAKADPNCQPAEGEHYWDLSGQGSPNPREHLAWVKQIHDGLGLPVLWWQMPLGVPSDAKGGTAGHYRDNRVQYFFEHVLEFEEAGGFGAAFGVGAPNQTTIATDDGQFARATVRYNMRPLNLLHP